MPRQKTIKRFEQWKEDGANIDAFFRLIEGVGVAKPLRFRDACVALKVPYTLMHAHMKASPDLKARYDAVRAANADQFAHEAVVIADGADEESKAGVMKAKLRVDTRLALASKWDRGDYGETLRVEKTVTYGVDAGLVGTIGDLLRVAKREPVTLENELGQADAETPLSAVLPAPMART